MQKLEMFIFVLCVVASGVVGESFFPQSAVKALSVSIALSLVAMAGVASLFDLLGHTSDKDDDEWPHYGGHTGE